MADTTASTRPLRSARNERGAALVIALLTMTLLSLLGGAAITTSNIEQMISANVKTTGKARAIARAGAERGRVALKTVLLNTVLDGRQAHGGAASTAYEGKLALSGCAAPTDSTNGSCAFGGGTYSVTVRNNTADDTTGSSATVDQDNIVIITSTGTDSTGASATIEVTVKKDDDYMPNLSGALSLVGDAEKSFGGCGSDVCRFDGRDWTAAEADAYDAAYPAWKAAWDAFIDANNDTIFQICVIAPQACLQNARVAADAASPLPTPADPSLDKYGIGVSNLTAQGKTDADLAAAVSQIQFQLCAAGMGSGFFGCGQTVAINTARGKGWEENTGLTDTGTMGVGSDIDLQNNEIQSFVDIAKGLADSTYTSADLANDGVEAALNTSLGADAITYLNLDTANTDVTFNTSQTITGSGLLILEGTEDNMLNINGTLNWDGLIIVVGDNVGLNFGTTGTANVTGGVVVAEQKLGETTTGNFEFRMGGGGGRLLYSSAQLATVQSAVSSKGGGRVKTVLDRVCQGLDSSGNCQ